MTTAGTVENRERPAEDQIVAACEAGFARVDLGGFFDEGLADYFMLRGYVYDPSAECTCADLGAHGHSVECRWRRNRT